MAYTEIAKIYGKGPDDMDAVFKLFKDHPANLTGVVDSTNHQMTMFQQGDIAVFMCSTNNVAHLKSLGLKAEFVHPEIRVACGARQHPSDQGRGKSRRAPTPTWTRQSRRPLRTC